MTDQDDQFCPMEGTPHERHCVHDQGHWMCEGEPEHPRLAALRDDATKLQEESFAAIKGVNNFYRALIAAAWEQGFRAGYEHKHIGGGVYTVDNPYTGNQFRDGFAEGWQANQPDQASSGRVMGALINELRDACGAAANAMEAGARDNDLIADVRRMVHGERAVFGEASRRKWGRQ